MAQEAAEDLPFVNKYKDKIIKAARKYKVEPSVVAGIISRETRGGRGAGFSNGWGDSGRAFGLMQIDPGEQTKPITLRGQWDSQEHIEQGIEILQGCASDVERNFPQLKGSMKAALAAYNKGTRDMDPKNVDAHTTWGNYSSDVLARAKYYARNGY